ncbi:hypothetical protein ACFL2Q_01120 [Thermodesulfobacteriota bacterium]
MVARIVREPFTYLLIQAWCVFALFSGFFAGKPLYFPDSSTYTQFDTQSVTAALSQVRTVGYPLFLKAIQTVSPDLSILPFVQFGFYVVAVLFFYCALRTYGFSKWLAFAVCVNGQFLTEGVIKRLDR